ncbi:hypothetical protein [Kribbella catacumbae]|uniref:hypothetical protein n=1 Tax=Kribbella catacumbae TaxID=460086 RepID=UPI00035F097C|nr:hypothetical protein [Kribbella catacumbae]
MPQSVVPVRPSWRSIHRYVEVPGQQAGLVVQVPLREVTVYDVPRQPKQVALSNNILGGRHLDLRPVGEVVGEIFLVRST